MARPRRRRARASGALSVVRQARAAAKRALDSLREEIRLTQTRLQKLVEEERSFRSELFGAVKRTFGIGGRPATRGPARRRRRGGRKQPPRAEKFFSRLAKTFTLDDVRRVAGRASGISLAQWSRAKRIRKTAKGYQKTQ